MMILILIGSCCENLNHIVRPKMYIIVLIFGFIKGAILLIQNCFPSPVHNVCVCVWGGLKAGGLIFYLAISKIWNAQGQRIKPLPFWIFVTLILAYKYLLISTCSLTFFHQTQKILSIYMSLINCLRTVGQEGIWIKFIFSFEKYTHFD